MVMALAAMGWLSRAGSETSSDTVERLLASQRAALESAPELAARLHELAAAEAAARSVRGAGTPYVEWQSEGFESGIDRAPNAQDTLRLGTPFNYPWNWGEGRRLEDATLLWTGAGREAARLDLAAEVGRRWLDLAAVTEYHEVVGRRLARLDEALNLQEAKYQLGEVAGTDVAQLDLEHVRESSRLADLEGRARGLRARLQELCGNGCIEPVAGDLEELVSLSTAYQGMITEAAVEAGAPYRSVLGEAEAARAHAELVSAIAFGRPEVEAEWEQFPSLEGLPGYDAWGFRLSVPLPIGSAGRQLRSAARAEVGVAASNLEATRRRYLQQIESEVAAAEGAEGRLSALGTVLDDLEQVEHSLSQQFRLGAIRYLVYIDGLSRLDDVRLEAIEARSQLLRSRLELAALLGDTSVFPLEVVAQGEDSR
jgi:outer membrane protein TolC